MPGARISILVLGGLLSVVSSALTAQTPGPAKCILVFGAHADDQEAMAGGTLAKYIHGEGYQGVYVVAINNTAGCQLNGTSKHSFTVSESPGVYPADALETIQIRAEEARRAAAVFGAKPVFFDFRETWIWHGRKQSYIGTEEFHRYDPPGRQVISVASRLRENVDLIVELLREYRPEITIIWTMGGDKHDHGNSAYLMYLAFRRAIARRIPVGKLWMRGDGWLAEPEARRSGRGKPDVRIDVTEYLDMKYAALNEHVSQNAGKTGMDLKPGERHYEEFLTVIDNTVDRERSELKGPVTTRDR